MGMLEDLYSMLRCISNHCTDRFSGVGVVVYDETVFDDGCHCDLRPNIVCPKYNVTDNEIGIYLASIADYDNELHDGFHMIDSHGNLTHVAQYFVPPVVKYLQPNLHHGVRLYSSICGSILKGVFCIGVVSSGRDIYILKDGNYVDLRKLGRE